MATQVMLITNKCQWRFFKKYRKIFSPWRVTLIPLSFSKCTYEYLNYNIICVKCYYSDRVIYFLFVSVLVSTENLSSGTLLSIFVHSKSKECPWMVVFKVTECCLFYRLASLLWNKHNLWRHFQSPKLTLHCFLIEIPSGMFSRLPCVIYNTTEFLHNQIEIFQEPPTQDHYQTWNTTAFLKPLFVKLFIQI